jgi:two-component system, cell cycle response regulator DivK
MARILVIEDDAAIRRLLQVNFAARGHSVLLAATGSEGIRLLQDEKPDLMMVDFRIPDMTGLEVIRYVHDDPALPNIPMLLVTGAAAELLGDVASVKGITAIIMKPIDLTDLFRRVQELTAR